MNFKRQCLGKDKPEYLRTNHRKLRKNSEKTYEEEDNMTE
jgi:hypothetical protein